MATKNKTATKRSTVRAEDRPARCTEHPAYEPDNCPRCGSAQRRLPPETGRTRKAAKNAMKRGASPEKAAKIAEKFEKNMGKGRK